MMVENDRVSRDNSVGNCSEIGTNLQPWILGFLTKHLKKKKLKSYRNDV